MDGDDVITCPSDRWDMERDCDIAEEVARYVEDTMKMPSTIMTGINDVRPTGQRTFGRKYSTRFGGIRFV